MKMLPRVLRREEEAPAEKGARSAKRSPVAARRSEARPNIIRETISELKKVTWPTWEQTRNLTTLVIAVSLAVGLVLGAIDWAFLQVVDKIMLGR